MFTILQHMTQYMAPDFLPCYRGTDYVCPLPLSCRASGPNIGLQVLQYLSIQSWNEIKDVIQCYADNRGASFRSLDAAGIIRRSSSVPLCDFEPDLRPVAKAW